MATKAYLKILDKAVMTVNSGGPNPFMPTVKLSNGALADMIWERLGRFHARRGYSRQYIDRLVDDER